MVFSSPNYLISILSLGQVLIIAIFTQYLAVAGIPIPLGWMFIVDMVVVGNTALSLVLMRKLMVQEEQANLIRQQAKHIQDLEEMIRNIRAQRHDFISHLQAVYGMLQMGKLESAREYLAEVTGDIRILTQTLKLKSPEVAALVQQKAALAASRNISFGLVIETDLSKVTVRPHNLNRILGNLLDNAMDAVAFLATRDRYIRLEINEDEENYIISVGNSGPGIREDLMEKIFEPGFSTKGENRGLGLAIVRGIVEQHGGQVRLTSPPTIFTVTLPKAGGE
ncbi:signal transduction histidine kinase regulating citrate/malate metabolism [Desulfofundulus kuznetsovii DSM 6115]|uniref:histidine kinase n=1 Tax=Desulfofundulus kuznetsovii (strain DSM 6115 / VKM B-1805 / 17) TaxID=760568 RepID=A0AAU8PJN7_DESK7|nr:signal transduction histidine kinase regulating citrate/malate metabolism [Desulfofundulus kuznetsovii DSM 6115]